MARFRPVNTPTLCAAAALLALAGCVGREGTRQPVQNPPLLAGVPIPEAAQLLDTTSTSEARRALLAIAWRPDSVAAYYRDALPKAGFRIVRDLGDSLSRNLYAERDGPPLWIQITAGRVSGISRFTLIGAVAEAPGKGGAARPDSARRAAPR